MSASVTVVGGGYGGVTVAKALDDVADVVLVEPRDAFVHNVAALRGLVDPDWAETMFLPYDRLLTRGRVVRDRAAKVDQTGVTLASGDHTTTDYTVLATGSAYPFPAKLEIEDSASAKTRIAEARTAVEAAERVLLIGAGPVGLEFAGEIKAVWPDKTVTVVEAEEQILTGPYPDELRAELRRQLDELGIELLVGTLLRELPASDVGQLETFTVTTEAGSEITADIWFRCFGVVPVSDYLAGELEAARLANGHVEVGEDLRLAGQSRVFALGDLTAIPEPKMAAAAGQHAELIAANIKTLISGSDELTSYQPNPKGIVVPLGPTGGASYRAGTGVLDAATTAQIKGNHLMMDRFADMFGLAVLVPGK